MPEVILPCPACAKDRADPAHRHHGQYSVICPDCYMLGPSCGTQQAAIAAWNAMPRALRWTHEPPKVAGWYWMRQQGESFDLIQHYNQADIDGGFDNERRLKQWAGPIAPPVEG